MTYFDFLMWRHIEPFRNLLATDRVCQYTWRGLRERTWLVWKVMPLPLGEGGRVNKGDYAH